MYSVEATAFFEEDIKKLSKKYPNIKKDFSDLIQQLEKGVFIGDRMKGFSDVFKVRVGSFDQKKGKQGGSRVIYYVVTKQKTVYLLSIYAKSKQANIKDKEIKNILETL